MAASAGGGDGDRSLKPDFFFALNLNHLGIMDGDFNGSIANLFERLTNGAFGLGCVMIVSCVFISHALIRSRFSMYVNPIGIEWLVCILSG